MHICIMYLYNASVVNFFKSASILTNLHSDTIDLSNEIPMQGPFTQNWVGGHQHRHVDLNVYDPLRMDDFTGQLKNKIKMTLNRSLVVQI